MKDVIRGGNVNVNEILINNININVINIQENSIKTCYIWEKRSIYVEMQFDL